MSPCEPGNFLAMSRGVRTQDQWQAIEICFHLGTTLGRGCNALCHPAFSKHGGCHHHNMGTDSLLPNVLERRDRSIWGQHLCQRCNRFLAAGTCMQPMMETPGLCLPCPCSGVVTLPCAMLQGTPCSYSVAGLSQRCGGHTTARTIWSTIIMIRLPHDMPSRIHPSRT